MTIASRSSVGEIEEEKSAACGRRSLFSLSVKFDDNLFINNVKVANNIFYK